VQTKARQGGEGPTPLVTHLHKSTISSFKVITGEGWIAAQHQLNET
jgi:hypothetical protein